MMKKYIIFTAFLIITTQSFYVHAHDGVHLGKINFPTSGSRKAQPYFEKGIMLLHSFEYKEARAEFLKAEKIDPYFSMAYWGEAMTYNHPTWGEKDVDSAKRVLDRYASTIEDRIHKTESEKENRLMKAITQLYGNGDKKTVDLAYAEAMRLLYQQYPDDDEIASFYALALLGTSESERDFRIYMQAAGIAEEIYGRNPLHPGALHYAIHSYDDPVHAPLGLRAARTYAKISPDASHALHMPSHIFMAMGMWDEVISSNNAAWKAGVKQNKSGKSSQYTIDDLHALQWLSYGYLQKKKYRSSYLITKEMEKIAVESNTPMAKWYYALTRAAYISGTNDIHADLKVLDLNEVDLTAQANDAYVNAMIVLNGQFGVMNIKYVNDLVANLEKSIDYAKHRQGTFKDFFTAVTPSGIANGEIIVLELKAQIKLTEGNTEQAVKLLKQANSLESGVSYGYGPPLPVVSSYEMLGDIFVKLKKYDEAYRVYLTAIKLMPNKSEVVRGLKVAKKLLKNHGQPVSESVLPYFNKLMLPEYYH